MDMVHTGGLVNPAVSAGGIPRFDGARPQLSAGGRIDRLDWLVSSLHPIAC